MWDQRYDQHDYFYGTEPNDFLRAMTGQLPSGGRVLCLAEGEGRNAVWLAAQGYQVTAMDLSAVGLAKGQRLADHQGVNVVWQQADLADVDLGQACWDGIVSIFAHQPSAIRRLLHQRCVAALAPGGVMLLEAYCPAQLQYHTGGPRDADLLPTAAQLQAELAGLQFDHLVELERDVIEGQGHTGRAAVVQLVARNGG